MLASSQSIFTLRASPTTGATISGVSVSTRLTRDSGVKPFFVRSTGIALSLKRTDFPLSRAMILQGKSWLSWRELVM